MKFIHLEHDSVNFNNNTPVFYQQEGSHAIRLVSHQLLFLTFCTIFTVRQRSWGKVLFSQVSVILFRGVPGPFWGGGNAWFQVPSGGRYAWPGPRSFSGGGGGYARYIPDTPPYPWKVHPIWRVHLPVLTSSGGQRSGRWASYWNAFLLFSAFNFH